MTAGAALRVRFVVGDVLMTGHARGAVGASPRDVDLMTCRTLAVTLTLRLVGNAMKAGQLCDLVAAGTGCACGHGAAVGLVARRAVTVTLGAVRELLLVTARACEGRGQLMDRLSMTRLTAKMSLISAS